MYADTSIYNSRGGLLGGSKYHDNDIAAISSKRNYINLMKANWNMFEHHIKKAQHNNQNGKIR